MYSHATMRTPFSYIDMDSSSLKAKSPLPKVLLSGLGNPEDDLHVWTFPGMRKKNLSSRPGLVEYDVTPLTSMDRAFTESQTWDIGRNLS